MKTLIRIAITGVALVAICWVEKIPATPPGATAVAREAPAWSVVYLADLEWTEAEVKQTVTLLEELEPDVVVSLSPCPFAEAIRNLECKPKVLDQTQRAQSGVACGVPAIPMAAYLDTSTLHSFGERESVTPGLVWLSAEAGKKPFNGPSADLEELRSLARMQIRKQLGERAGEVIFLVDPSVPTPVEERWRLPRKNVRYEQAASAVTGFACIRPESLQSTVAGIDGIYARVPVLHRIHSGAKGMEWDVLPIDGGPAVQHVTYKATTKPGDHLAPTIHWLKAPAAPSEVPLWMDEYVNSNPALGTGDTIPQRAMKRRFGWRDYGVTRDKFHLLRSGENPAPEVKPETPDLPRGAVRSPGGLFAITVGQLSEKGWYPTDGDDGINVYLDDRRLNKRHLLYFAGLYDAWPAAATWFSDRYVITSGTGAGAYEWDDENAYSTSPVRPQTLRLFDLQTGRAFVTQSFPQVDGRPNAPTERIYFPQGSSYTRERHWQYLWKAIEDGYQAKPEEAPVTVEEVAAIANFPGVPGVPWKDLGIWPAPENWRLAPEAEDPSEKSVNGGDPFLSYLDSGDGQRNYRLAISSFQGQSHFDERDAVADIVAHADLFTTGEGSLPQLETIQRLGDRKQYLALAGSFQKPGSGKGKWMLLVDLLKHRAWSAHW